MDTIKTARTVILIFAFFISFVACKKEANPPSIQNPGETEPVGQYKRPQEETILLAAAAKKVEVNGMDNDEQQYTVYFAEPYSAAGKVFNSISILKNYIKAASKNSTSIVITFKDDATAKFDYQKEVSLDIDTSLEFSGYMSEEIEVPFSVKKLGRGDISFSVKGSDGFTPTIDYNVAEHKGAVRFSLNRMPGVSDNAVITLTDGSAKTEYTIKATTYHFTVETQDIILAGDEGSTSHLSFKVTTDIPAYELIYETEGDFFSLSDGIVTATTENRTGGSKAGQISIFESRKMFSPGIVKITQGSLPAKPREDCITFNDINFKQAMKLICDNDQDGEISFDEALTVQEIVANNAGIKDLSGLEYFKNAWKVDLQNNDIQDATVLKNLSKLYWLDLKGNKNLRTFDVTGCTQYFEHCEFEITPTLSYYTYRQQVGVTSYSDPECEHSHHVIDNRETVDWSRNFTMHKVQAHTKELDSHIVPSIVFTGIGYLDIDMTDGSFERQMKKAISCFWQLEDKIAEFKEYFDVYWMEHIIENRNQYYICLFEWDPYHFPEIWYGETRTRFWNDYYKMCENSYELLYGETDFAVEGITKQFPPQLCITINCNPLLVSQHSVWGYDCGNNPLNTYDYRWCQYTRDLQTHARIGADREGVEREDFYSRKYNYCLTIEDLFSDDVDGWRIQNNEAFDNSFIMFCGFNTNNPPK